MRITSAHLFTWLRWCCLWFVIASAHADVFRPAYLELRELGDGRYDILWKVPAQDADTPLALAVVLPLGSETVEPPLSVFASGAITKRWQVQRHGGLAGETVRVVGNASGVTDVIARVERSDGTSQVERLPAGQSEFVVKVPAGRIEIAWSYLVLGIEHILGGTDHLLFLLTLLLIVRGTRRIVATVSAFTVAHSITLVAATLGWVHVPNPPVEAAIALSIVFVAAEVVQGWNGRPGLTARAPWLVAFAFGLLHGFGFAGALAEVGLPQTAIPVALLTFNVGVELGQLMFVAAVLAAMFALRRFSMPAPRWVAYALPYGIGTIATFWMIERIAAF